MIELETCPGCGAQFAPHEGPTHDYMLSSPACWAAYGRVLAAEYEDFRLMPTHRLSVDAYALQHPGDPNDRRAVQSVALHLARLYRSIELGLEGREANRPMLEFTRRKVQIPVLDPPSRFTLTVADVEPLAGSEAHADKVREWARATLDDWSHAHEAIRAFIEG